MLTALYTLSVAVIALIILVALLAFWMRREVRRLQTQIRDERSHTEAAIAYARSRIKSMIEYKFTEAITHAKTAQASADRTLKHLFEVNDELRGEIASMQSAADQRMFDQLRRSGDAKYLG